MEHTAAEAVIGMLSIAGLEHGVTQVSANDLDDRLNTVNQEYPSLIPRIPSRDMWMRFLYSDLVSPRNDISFKLGADQWTIHLTADAARRNLAVIQGRRGEDFIKALGMAAQVFVQQLKASAAV